MPPGDNFAGTESIIGHNLAKLYLRLHNVFSPFPEFERMPAMSSREVEAA